MTVARKITGLVAAAGAALVATATYAQDLPANLPIIGRPTGAGIGFQPAATGLARELHWLDNFLLVIITVISLFVTGLLLWVAVRYNKRVNKEPARFTHNSPLEVAWTLIPVAILIMIGGFSLPVLFNQQTIPEGDVYIKATGYQWYWGYEYADEDIRFDSYLVGHPATITDAASDAGAQPYVLTPAMEDMLVEYGYTRDEWLLATDTAVVVPVNKTVVMQVTAADVIHSWTIPAFGVKQDGIPGRLAQLWFKAEREGIYFGQCSELCGKDHAYMPITVKVVSDEAYAAWLENMKTGDMIAW
jgi:cytochrome c oxidase subunit 2